LERPVGAEFTLARFENRLARFENTRKTTENKKEKKKKKKEEKRRKKKKKEKEKKRGDGLYLKSLFEICTYGTHRRAEPKNFVGLF